MKKIKTTLFCTRRAFYDGKFHDKEKLTLKVNITTPDIDRISVDYLQNEYLGQKALRIDNERLTIYQGHFEDANIDIEDF